MLLQEEALNLKLFEKLSTGIQEWEEIWEQLQNTLILPKPIKIHLIRHAQSKVNADKRVTGSQDVELTIDGEEQASELGMILDKRYDIAFASTLQRSQRTLEIAIESGGIDVGETVYDTRLNERHLGVLEGQKSRWIPEYSHGDLYYAPANGESYEKVARRVFSFLLDLAHFVDQQPVSTVLISGHMGPMRIMIGILTEKEQPTEVLGLSFSNAEVVELTWERLQIPGFLRTVFA